MERIEVDPVDVVERPVDGRGRVSVGTSLAGETARVAVLDVGEREPLPGVVTVCFDCDAVHAGLRTHCPDCGSESVRQEDVEGSESEPDEDDGDDDREDERAWLCWRCQQTILSVDEPDECPACGSPEAPDSLDVVRAD
jgi:rubrerythrin